MSPEEADDMATGLMDGNKGLGHYVSTLAARRGSGTAAKAVATLAGDTDRAATPGVDSITGSFAVGKRAEHTSILAKQPRPRDSQTGA